MNKSLHSNWFYPAIFAIIIYGFIRLVTDTFAGRSHIRAENTSLILIELSGTILGTYLIAWILLRYEIYLNRRPLLRVTTRQIIFDFLGCWGIIMIAVNVLMTPMVALTDDGLSWADLVVINVIPAFLTLIWFGLRRGSFYLQAYMQQQLTLEQVKRERVEGELKWLRSQIQPHFLFNALNTIYFQIDDTPKAAKGTIEQLSRLLRHSLYESEKELIDLQKEVDYIQDYIAIQRTRKSDQLEVKVAIELKQPHQIAPHLLVPFVENAFKYVGGNNKQFIDIQLIAKDNQLIFTVRNSIPQQPAPSDVGGIGLTNLRRRLDLLYQGQYDLKVAQSESTFLAKLELKFPKNTNN
ncbi:MAG: histidine kinase [Bacteroidota bacterium]